MTNQTGQEERVLVAMPTGRDADLVCEILERAGIACESVNTRDLTNEINSKAGAVLLAEEALRDILEDLESAVESQPVWSDIPMIIFSSGGSRPEYLLQTLSQKFNATIVERPIRITMLVSAVRGALRARQRQYQTRDLLKQLKQADQQKDLFLATLSHELRTPLNSILGWIHILKRREFGDADLRHALDVIDRNARAQSEMIADILLVSRVITGKVELALQPTEVMRLLESSVDVIQPSAQAKEISISFDTSKYSPTVIEGDPERLQQVFLNLLTNAVKFTPHGGKIDIRLKRLERDVQVEINDNGHGIDPKFLPFIFERFRQADNKHTRRVGGLGLGLAIVSHLVELHGGTVKALSGGKNRGACFTVTLPIGMIDGAILEESQHDLPPADSSGGKSSPLQDLKVLVVEDDDDSRDMLETILTFSGAEVETASDATSGFEKFRFFRPDILISDVGLPGQDGYDLIRHIRNLPPNESRTPAIALTGYVSTQDQAQAICAGYQEHLPKPVDTNQLIETIVRLIRTDGGSKLGTGTL